MRQALECCHRGWGESIVIGVAEAGKGDRHAAVPARHRPGLEGHAFGGARGPHGRAQDRRLVHGGKINIDDLITHTMPLDEINTAFDLMHEGKSIRSVVVY
jgi:S-(hydroxymethyl)glutathione dehydrogenase/alcohol dehydrogenase